MFRQATIRKKLALVLWGAALVAFLVAGGALLLFQHLTLKHRARQILAPYAQLVSVGAEAAVVFGDPERAEQILETLRANPQMLGAEIVLKDGTPLASYVLQSNTALRPFQLKPDGVYLERESVELLQALPGDAHLRLVMRSDQLTRLPQVTLWLFSGGVLILLVITLGQMAALQRTIIHPISTLAETTEQVRVRGDYTQRVPASGMDEVAQLGQSFNAMMEAIQQRGEALQLNAERTNDLLRLNQMAGATQEKITHFAFEAAVRLTGSKLGYLAFLNEEEPLLTMQLWSSEAMAQCRAMDTPRTFLVEKTGPWSEAVRQRRPIITNDCKADNPWKNGTPEGNILLTRHMSLPVIVGDRIVLVAGVGNKQSDYNDTDLQQLTLLMEGMWRLIERTRAEAAIQKLNQELEQRVLQRTTQLEAANKELESFSYSVSHDLRAPLRSIDGFSQALLEDYAPKLDEEGRRYLERVRLAAQRMSQLIDDMLSLARVTRGEMAMRDVDLTSLAQEIADELAKREPARKVTFAIAPNAVATGDIRFLRGVLENLLGNAWKFTSKRQEAKIEFGLTQQNGARTFFVRDNGAGFDMQYASRLFGVFQRLHTTDNFPGTGIGLATVQRIVHRHGGRVWAEGQVDHGATFYFSLPDREPALRVRSNQ